MAFDPRNARQPSIIAYTVEAMVVTSPAWAVARLNGRMPFGGVRGNNPAGGGKK